MVRINEILDLRFNLVTAQNCTSRCIGYRLWSVHNGGVLITSSVEIKLKYFLCLSSYGKSLCAQVVFPSNKISEILKWRIIKLHCVQMAPPLSNNRVSLISFIVFRRLSRPILFLCVGDVVVFCEDTSVSEYTIVFSNISHLYCMPSSGILDRGTDSLV